MLSAIILAILLLASCSKNASESSFHDALTRYIPGMMEAQLEQYEGEGMEARELGIWRFLTSYFTEAWRCLRCWCLWGSAIRLS